MADLKIPAKAKIRVYWEDLPENYTKKGKSDVITHFHKTYGVSRKQINVVFRPIKIDEDGNRIELSELGIDNINDVNHQRELFKQYLANKKINVDFDRIVALDNKVNAAVNLTEGENRYRKWGIKWIAIDNFLSFGPQNLVNYNELEGLTVVTSDPPNQGGKTVFSIDAFMFLCFGQTTKTTKNEDIFNTFTDKNIVTVSGLIEIEGGEEYIIERKLTRKSKRDGGWTIISRVEYYEVEPDGTKGEPLDQKEETGIATTKKIKESIGKLEDFEVTIIATANTLEDLIETKPTARGKMLTKFIGLEVIEKKEEVARKMHNKFQKTMKSNIYSIADLAVEIGNHEEQIEFAEATLKNFNKTLEENKIKLVEINNLKDTLIGNKKDIDPEIQKLNPDKLKLEEKGLINKGIEHKEIAEKITNELNAIGDIGYDEDVYVSVSEELVKVTIESGTLGNEIKSLEELIDTLVNGEICPQCKRPLEDVDHSKEIKENKDKLEKAIKKLAELTQRIAELTKEKESYESVKKAVDTRDKLELTKEKSELEMDKLRTSLKHNRKQTKEFNRLIKDIETNKQLDSDVLRQNTKLENLGIENEKLIRNIQKITDDIELNQKHIKDKKDLIVKIKKEDEIDRIFKIYVEMVGKKGISKMVLRTVLPIINSELQRLLDDTCDFDLELQMTEKNDVEFILIKDGVEKQLKSGSGLERTLSSLALRCVLGRISVLPKPNIIVFDEVLGKVASENYENVKILFDKIKDMFDTIILITHELSVRDWADTVLMVKKTRNISKIETV